MSAKRLMAALVAFAGATAFTACLLALVAGMRDVMQTDGDFCASGGPYVIAHQCSSADIRLIMVGIFGALIAAGFYAGGSAGRGLQPGPGTTFQPGMLPVPGTGAVAQAAARSAELLRTSVWLIVSLAGTGFGIALSASLISTLR